MELLSNRLAKRSSARRTGRCLACLLAIGLAATGCTQTLRVEQADQGEQVEVDSFLHEHLPAQAMVTVAEAYRAMLLLADGDEQCNDFAARQAALEERGIARPAWGLRREACIDRGSVAYMVCRILQIRGGLNLNLLGGLGIGDRRYAVRELVYLDLMPPGAAYRYMTGGELAEVMLEADRYMARHGMYEAQEVDITEVIESGSAETP